MCLGSCARVFISICLAEWWSVAVFLLSFPLRDDTGRQKEDFRFEALQDLRPPLRLHPHRAGGTGAVLAD